MSYSYTEGFPEAVSGVLHTEIIYSVLAICAVIAGGLLFSGKKKLGSNLLIGCGILFIGCALGKSIFLDHRLSKESPGIDTGRAEFMLEVGTSFDRITANSPMKISDKHENTFDEASKVLRKGLSAEPDSVEALAKVIIVEREASLKDSKKSADYKQPLEHLSKLPSEKGKTLGSALTRLYQGGPLSAADSATMKTAFLTDLPKGWYQDTTLAHFYTQTKEKKELAALNEKMDERAMSLVLKVVALTVFALFAVLIGLITLSVQLLFVARNPKDQNAESRELVQAPADYGAKSVIAVFIAWLSTQLLVGVSLQLAMKTTSTAGLFAAGANSPPMVVMAALSMAAFYTVSNGPGMLYAYFFALKPHGIGFFEGLKLRLRVGKNGPGKMILSGIMTWFVAVPLVIVSFLIGTKFGSQGSSNPIIGLVMEAAHTGNVLAFVLFYLTLGVLAPICEETLFRGFLYSSLRRKMGIFPSVVISAALFAGLHLDAGGLLPLFTLGCLFALVMEKTKSIVPSMITHGMWNSGTFTLVLLLFGN